MWLQSLLVAFGTLCQKIAGRWSSRTCRWSSSPSSSLKIGWGWWWWFNPNKVLSGTRFHCISHLLLFFFVVDGLMPVLDSINKQTNKGRRHWVHHYRLCYCGQCKDERGDYQGDYFFLRLLRILLSEMVIIMCWVWWWFWGNNLKNLVFIDDANHH